MCVYVCNEEGRERRILKQFYYILFMNVKVSARIKGYRPMQQKNIILGQKRIAMTGVTSPVFLCMEAS